MIKQELLEILRKRLSALPTREVEDRLSFLSETIDDRIEEGLCEEDAVAAVGTPDEIFDGMVAEIPLGRIVKETVRPKRRMSRWEITLLVLGFPVWLPLLVSAFAVALSLYASLWSVIISLWSAFGAIFGCAVGGVLGGIGLAFFGYGSTGLALLGAGLVCAGVSIFAFQGCKALTRATLHMTRAAVRGTKHRLVKGGMNRE